MMSGLLVRVEDIHARLQKKAAQDSFVMRSLGSGGKSGPQLSQNNKRQPDFVGKLDCFDN